MPEKNPTWSRDELILALALYQQFGGNPPGKSSKDVTELSALLNRMGMRLSQTAADYRNANGVYMKVMNFRRFDPVYISQGKVGLQRGGKLEADVWNDFANDATKLTATAEAIRLNTEAAPSALIFDDESEDFAEAKEGRLLTRIHIHRERNRKLVDKKKAMALKKSHRLVCEVCSFDFEAAYGDRGTGFIEAHHTKPLITLVPGSITRLEDLALLCANCHRMIHAKKPWLSLDELRDILRHDIP